MLVAPPRDQRQCRCRHIVAVYAAAAFVAAIAAAEWEKSAIDRMSEVSPAVASADVAAEADVGVLHPVPGAAQEAVDFVAVDRMQQRCC